MGAAPAPLKAVGRVSQDRGHLGGAAEGPASGTPISIGWDQSYDQCWPAPKMLVVFRGTMSAKMSEEPWTTPCS